MAGKFFNDGCKKVVAELKTYLDSLGDKLATEEKEKILDFANRVEHVARADGIVGGLMTGMSS